MISNIYIIKRLYKDYTVKHLKKIILAIFFSILVAISTSGIAYLLDPAIEKIFIDGLPIKKWVNVIIRVNSQNIVDVYINGTLTKRHKLSNIIKQNYENININMNGGFDGFMSNLKYYNYSIGTFEIDSIVTSGPNLKMSDGSSIKTSKPYYLANDWFYSN